MLRKTNETREIKKPFAESHKDNKQRSQLLLTEQCEVGFVPAIYKSPVAKGTRNIVGNFFNKELSDAEKNLNRRI